MRPRAFLDANVLRGQLTTDVLLSLADERLLVPRWSAQVLSEVRRNRPAGVTADRIDARFAQMNKAFPAAMTSGYDGLTQEMRADAKDKHVLAAAVHSRSTVLVTENLKDFDPPSVGPYAIEVERTSAFLNHILAESPERSLAALQAMVRRNRRTPRTMPELLAKMASQHDLNGFARALNSVIPPEHRILISEAARSPHSIALDGTAPPIGALSNHKTVPDARSVARQIPSNTRSLEQHR